MPQMIFFEGKISHYQIQLALYAMESELANHSEVSDSANAAGHEDPRHEDPRHEDPRHEDPRPPFRLKSVQASKELLEGEVAVDVFSQKKDQSSSHISLSVVVPLYNEEESVAKLLRRLEESLAPMHHLALINSSSLSVETHKPVSLNQQGLQCEVILVDDGSRDSTYGMAVKVAKSLSIPVRIVSLQRNFGQTAAMQAGIDAAKGELIATMDGDLQNDPADIPRMVNHFLEEDLDLLCGRRKKRQDGMVLRLIPSWIANRLIAAVTGVTISDNGCSLKIYRASIIKQVRLMGEMHRFIPAWVSQVTHPSKISEIDVRHHARQHGQSKYGISRTIRVVLDLMAVLFFMRFRARPGHFFGIVGMGIGTIGTLMLGSLVISKYGFGEDIGGRPMLIIGALAMLSAVQFICFGIMAEMLTRIYHQSGGSTTYVVRTMAVTHGTLNHQNRDESLIKKAG